MKTYDISKPGIKKRFNSRNQQEMMKVFLSYADEQVLLQNIK